MSEDILLSDFEQLKMTCSELERRKIYVGIVSAQDSEVLKIAHAHEYGDGKLPERSFIRASFDTDQDKLQQIVESSVDKAMAGRASPDAALNAIGAQAAQCVQSYIDENRVKPPSDFSKKTQHTTLYETGTHIRDRIAYEVRDEK